MDDDDDEEQVYRRVDLEKLVQDVPGLSGYAHDLDLVCGAVDVVLNRASGRVGSPTAYVGKAISQDLYGVIGTAMSMLSPVRTSSGVSRSQGLESNVVDFQTRSEAGDFEAQPAQADAGTNIPDVDELGADAVPCTNLDHLQSYEPSARQLAHCNHCRLDPVDASEDDRHIANATTAQIAALPERLQPWVEQFRPDGQVTEQSSERFGQAEG